MVLSTIDNQQNSFYYFFIFAGYSCDIIIFVPYIFDDEELTALFIAIDSFKSKDDTF